MPAGENTRHCSQCERNIHDFTGMTPAQITHTIKSSVKPCGFMLPWQLNQVNDYLRQQRSDLMINRLSRLAKLAAMFSAPLFITQAQAQQQTTPTSQNAGREQEKNSEIVLTTSNGAPLTQTKVELVNQNGQTVAWLTTDASGRIYPNKNISGQLVLRNTQLGIEKTIQLGSDPVCIVWNTQLPDKSVAVQPQHHYSFNCRIDNGKKVKKLAHTKVSVILYDSTNQELGTLQLRTNASGELKINDSDLQNAAHLSFQFNTKEGIKSTYSTLKSLDMIKANELIVYDYEERFMMGIMISDF